MTMKQRIVHTGILISVFAFQVFAQTDPTQELLTPSPTAAAFTKYVDFPVNTATGTPSTSVPLGTLSGRGIAVPVSLEYHAGGVRVDDVSSIVGLGWTLNAGGVVNRTVVGIADEDGEGFMNHSSDVPLPPISSQSSFSAMQNFASGGWDGQPDIFQFSFGSYSGKFIFENSSTVRLIPQQDLKISYTTCTTCPGQMFSGSIISITITTPDGLQYLFGTSNAVEYSTTGNYNAGGNVGCSGKTYDLPAATAWYLKSITNPKTADVITFTYGSNRIYYDHSYNESFVYPYPGNYVGTNSCPITISASKCVTTKSDNGVYLISISSSQGRVDFTSNATRSDVTVQLGQYRINEVKFYGHENTLLKSYNLVQSFVQSSGSTPSTASTSTYRMYLDEIKEYSSTGALINTQAFEYYNRQSLPPRLSMKQDTWGFFNSKNNVQATPAPDNTSFTLQYIQTFHPSFTPADRSPDANFAYYGTLKKVTYPTGGAAEYEYEGNQLPVCQTVNVPTMAQAGISATFAGTPQTQTLDFYVDHDQWVFINYYVLMIGLKCYGASASIKALDVGNPFTGLTWGGCLQNLVPIELQGSQDQYLTAGNYRLEVKVFQGPEPGYPPPFNTSPESASIAVRHTKYIPTYINNEPTGGIRVKKITATDGMGYSPNIVKVYKYHKSDTTGCADASSGYYMGRSPKYLTIDYSMVDPSPEIICDYELCRYYRITSNSMLNLTGNGGAIVNYREVWALDGANAENGKKYFRHEIYQDGNSQLGPNFYDVFLNAPTVDYSWKNGRLVEEKSLTAQNQPVSQSLYEYEFNETAKRTLTKAIVARQVFIPVCQYDYQTNPVQAMQPYAIEWYDVISQFVYLKKKTDRVFNSNGTGNYVETITDYQYDLPALRHYMPVKTITTNNDGTQYATKSIYPPEYVTTSVSDAPSIAIKGLQDNFIINAPVEQVKTIKKPSQSELVTGGQLTKFRNYGGAQIFPNEILQVETTSPLGSFIYSSINGGNFSFDSHYFQSAQMSSYDSKGNLKEWNKKDDQISTFIYGHGENLPIAHVRNAMSTEVAFTSFEEPGIYTAEGNGNWLLSGSAGGWNSNSGYVYSGKNGYNISNGIRTASRSNLSAGKYVVSFFYRDGIIAVNGVNASTSYSSAWQYAEVILNIGGGGASSVSVVGVSGNPYIDELRLHPIDALMRTFSFENNSLLVWSASDENSIPVHYDYDASQRLQAIRDQDRNIVQTYEYNYQQAGPGLNDIKARTVLVSGQTTLAQVNALSGASVQRIFQFMDGLGRPIQINGVAQSPSQKDIITHQEYDAFGRSLKNFMPYTITSNGGIFRTGAASEQSSFANSYGSGGYGFTETKSESSPLNRPLEQGAPGATWGIGNGHTIDFVYRGNTSAEAVRDFTNNNYFPADQLLVTEETDENERKKYLYTDKLGRTILVKQQIATNPTSEDDHWARTYTVYDDFGRIAAVIPPEAAKKMKTSGNWTWTSGTYASMIYKYTYDSRGRMSTKTVPSGGTTSFWYDRLDRPVLTQDANGFKTFTRYDILGRPIVNGRYKGSAVPGTLEPLFEIPNSIGPHYYSTQSFPTDNNLDVYQVFYFDDYDLDNNGSLGAGETYTNPAESGYETEAFLRVRGKATASKVAILKNDNSAPSTYLLTRTYYDKEYSLIQEKKQNHLNGADITSSAYNFANRLIKTRRDHTATPPLGDPNSYVIREDYVYDHAGRLSFTVHQINSNKREIIAANAYDELDRLKEKNQHASNYSGSSIPALGTAFNYLQSIDYSYNIRGWLTSINDPSSCAIQSGDNLADMFSMKLEYETVTNGGSPQFNGNISSWEWNTYLNNTCGTRQLYRYYYDAANRLTTANHYYRIASIWTFGNRYSATNLVYDLNGNIQTLKRRGVISGTSTYGDIDNLVYYFDDVARPDRLTRVVDAASATKGFVYNASASSPHYIYDSNGNLTQDQHKNMTVAYNHLNLPKSFTISGGTITMTYTAAGEKLSKVSGSVVKNYCSGIEYSGAALEAIYHAEGRCTPVEGTFFYNYSLKDHLGNVRVNWRASGTFVTFLDEHHYYPFGMEMEGAFTGGGNPYRYNSKELNKELGLDWYDYGARWYDASLGRFPSIDPLGEMMSNWSGYTYVFNNPLNLIDPFGTYPEKYQSQAVEKRREPILDKREDKTLQSLLQNVLRQYVTFKSDDNPDQGEPKPAQGEPKKKPQGDPPAKRVCCGDKNDMYVDRLMGTDKVLDRTAYESSFYEITIPVAEAFAFYPLSWLRFGWFGGAAAKGVTNLSTRSLTPTQYITKSQTAMQTLMNDIRANGIQESIKYVEHNGVKYIVDGHHRFYAAQKLGIQNVPVQQVQLPYRGYKGVMDLIMETGKQPGFWKFMK